MTSNISSASAGNASAANQQRPAGAAQQQHAAYQQQQQQQIDADQKKLYDFIESLTLIGNIRDGINTILDNVGKSNPSSNNSALLASTSNSVITMTAGGNNAPGVQGQAVIYDASQGYEQGAKQNLTSEQLEFFEKTDSKNLQEKVVEINKNLIELDKILKDLQPVQTFPCIDYNAILLDQTDERTNLTSYRLLNNYRWSIKLSENINSTVLTTYKRFQQTYNERKSLKYRTYPVKPIIKTDLDKLAAQYLTNNEIKVVSFQKTENEFVLDIIMPQNFKFVILLFDVNVEKLQVRQLDSRLLKIYTNNKPSDEICCFDYDHKNASSAFQRLEENCLFACLYFRTEYGNNHLRHLMSWLKNFTNLFNAKCVRCEKHLLYGVPPTWRDLKTHEPYHDECRM